MKVLKVVVDAMPANCFECPLSRCDDMYPEIWCSVILNNLCGEDATSSDCPISGIHTNCPCVVVQSAHR
jgi:hypothetical protein